MKYSKTLPISVASLILVIFIAVSFIVYDKSEIVAVKGVAGSYAQTFASENELEFIEIHDSENDAVEIPIIDESQYATKQKKKNNSDKLSKPKNVVAQTKSVNSISLTWSSVKNADSYDIYQITADGASDKIATTSDDSPTAYLIEKLAPNTTYFYAVQALTEDEEIDDSDLSKITYAITAKENADFSYDYEGETINITDYKGVATEIVVPETIDNLPVKTISMEVTGKGIKIVQVPESVTNITSSFKTARYDLIFFTSLTIMALGYVFAIIATFIGLRKAETTKATFYGIPFVYSGMVTYIGISILCFIALLLDIKPIPQIIVAIIVFGIAIIKLLTKTIAKEIIVDKDKQVGQQTKYIKLLTAEANSLMSSAKSDKAKTIAKNVYEAVRYSDPMSTPGLNDIEKQIKNEFYSFSRAIKHDDVELASKSAGELICLINERNQKIKALK